MKGSANVHEVPYKGGAACELPGCPIRGILLSLVVSGERPDAGTPETRSK
jgi:hypothetical protein